MTRSVVTRPGAQLLACDERMVVLELYFKQLELTEKLLPNVILPLHQRLQAAAHLPGGGLSRVLLTYKGRPSAAENPADAAKLRAALPPEVAVSCVWSAKNAYVGSGRSARGEHATKECATFAKFAEYNRQLEAAGCDSILVVSGAGNKKLLDSVETVRRAAATAPPPLPLGVAFNPHIGGALDPHGDETHREAEWARLRAKLASGAVSQVWIAFGADTAALRHSLERLRKELGGMAAPPQLLGSLFVPSKAWIAKMRFRCWTGTFLGDKDAEGGYLSSVAAATAVTKETLELFVEYGVEPVIESSVRTAKEMEEAIATLMAPADDDAARHTGAAGRGAGEAQSGGGEKRPHNAM